MKYTREQLEQMSDFEINKALAEKLKLRLVHVRDCMICYQMDYGGSMAVDYCNNWNDIMPLAVEYEISLYSTATASDDEWEALKIYPCITKMNVSGFSKSPQRAIACCLLMMGLNK